MYKEGYILHNSSIPYYASDYRHPASSVFIFHSIYNLEKNIAEKVDGILIFAISDQIGASIHDRIHFKPAIFLDGANAIIANRNPSYIPFLTVVSMPGGDNEGDGGEGDGGDGSGTDPNFNPPLGPARPESFCNIYIYEITLINVTFYQQQ